MAPLLLASVALASACDVTTSGSGTVTVVSDTPAESFDADAQDGTVVHLCSVGASSCGPTDPFLYTYYPATGETEWIVSPGFPVLDNSGGAVGLPAGEYTVGVTEYLGGDPPLRSSVAQFDINIYGDAGPDLTVWTQSYARASQDASCETGWDPSWAQWPSEGSGGFVCNRRIYAYQPDVPVR